ncbi:MAG: hypothetical protein RIQ60_2628 [Pseudomonadota bacterium]|jgi:outer membrane protein OmpA-like peptidoglycan-associated protein
MARISESCRWCTWALAVAVLLVGWFGFVRGDARPELLRQRAQEQANREIAVAGYPWVQLRIEGNTARVIGRAPSDEALQLAQANLERLLSPYMGMPGVFARLQNQLEVMSAAEQQAARDARAAAAARLGASGAALPDRAALAVKSTAELKTAAAAGSAAVLAASAALRDPSPLNAAATSTASLSGAAAATDALVRPDPACQKDLDRLQQKRVLHFRAGSATLDVGQEDALDSLAALLKRCPDGRVLVHGLREPVSNPAATADASSAGGADGAVPAGGAAASATQFGGGLLLAQRRAQAVRSELMARGIAQTRLQLGAGAREVAGDTPARVELTLAPTPRS